MTTKEIEVIEAEVVEEDTTLTKREATALNKKIQNMSEKVANNAFELLSLLEQAVSGNIHKALGYKSWSDWYSANVQIEVTDADERKMLATMMSGKGMSQRAIAKSLGIGQATVSRDLADEEGDPDESPGTTTGLDGKEYKKKSKADVADDADEAEDEEPNGAAEDKPVKRQALPKMFDAAVTAVIDAVNELLDVTEDDRFAKAHKQLANKLGDDVIAVADGIHEVLDKLGIDYAVGGDEETDETEETEDDEADEEAESEGEDE